MTRFAFAFGLVALVAGCPEEDKDSPTGETGNASTDVASTDVASTDAPPPETANVRVLHLGQGVPGVDVFANDAADAAVTNLMFKNGTDYLNLPVGMYNFDVAVNPGSADAPDLTLDATLAADTSYVAVAYGFLTPNDSPDALTIAAFVETDGDVPANTTRLKIRHAAAGVGTVDILNLTDENNISTIAANVDFGAETGNVDVPPGALVVGLDVDALSGGDADGTADVTFNVPDLGAGYFAVYAVNSGAQDAALDVSLVAHTPDGTTTELSPAAE